MNSNPLVSIVIPTRNRKKLLIKALSSIIQQSYSKLQIIVHDNNTSNLSEIDINPNEDSRIEFYKSSEDLGMLENWRRGLCYVRGDLFLRFDDDNIMCRTYIEKVVNHFMNAKIRMVTSNCLLTQNNRSINSLVAIGEGHRKLSRQQLLHFTYHNIIDSNYSVYDFKFLIDNFGADKIYETNLPDRYLDLRFANIINDNEVIYIESISGVTRMDYRLTEFNTKLGEYSFDEIMKFRGQSLPDQLSPHNNFTLSRFYVFLRYYQEGWVDKKHFFNKIISYTFLEMELLIGNFVENKKSIFEQFLYYMRFVTFLITNPKSYYQSKSGPRILLFVTKVMLKSLYLSFHVNLNKKKACRDLYFWHDRLESKSIEEFVNVYGSEAAALGGFNYDAK